MHYSSRLLALALAAAAGTGAVPTPEQQSPTISRRAVPVGQIITSCTVPGTVALTFDDGPYIYTGQALDQLGAAGFKATFFLNGQNWGSISDYASTVVRMRNEGHQVGSHTWSHADLATLDSAGVTSQMTMLEDALVGIIGVRPTYMRPPYLSTNSMVLSTLGGLGYHVISVDIDTLDYNLQGNIAQAAANFEAGLNAGGSISLAHDVHQNTVQQLIGMLIQKVQQRGLTPVTVGECLGDPAANWYAGARGTTPPTDPTDPTDPGSSLPTSPDSTCGAAAGYRCPSGECCSQWGWCGTTSEYCASGCQSAFGNCS